MSTDGAFNRVALDRAARAAAKEAAQVPAAGASRVKVIPDTDYTLKPEDAGLYLRFTAATAVTLRVPTNLAAAMAINSTIEGEQAGLGTVTVTPAVGATVNSRGGVVATAGRYAVFMFKKVAADTLTLTGDLA
jgi:hypothetical protein